MSIAQEAVNDVAEGAGIVLDVRREDEWVLAHAKGAVHWDIWRLQKGERPGCAARYTDIYLLPGRYKSGQGRGYAS